MESQQVKNVYQDEFVVADFLWTFMLIELLFSALFQQANLFLDNVGLVFVESNVGN